MNTVELTNIMRKRVKKGVNFLGVLACDQLPVRELRKLPAMVIINTHASYKPGEHWVSVYITTNRRGLFYDSFGNPPSYKGFPTYIIRFLKTNCIGSEYSSRQVQSDFSLTCGQHCVFFLLNIQRGLSYRDFMRYYSSDLLSNDVMVCNFVKQIRVVTMSQNPVFKCIQCARNK